MVIDAPNMNYYKIILGTYKAMGLLFINHLFWAVCKTCLELKHVALLEFFSQKINKLVNKG